MNKLDNIRNNIRQARQWPSWSLHMYERWRLALLSPASLGLCYSVLCNVFETYLSCESRDKFLFNQLTV